MKRRCSVASYHTVGLKRDGRVLAVGNNRDGQCNVNGWTDIVQVTAGSYHTVGLKRDGTLMAVGNNYYYECDVSGWNDIVQVAAGENHTVGLKKDGRAVAVGWNMNGRCDVNGWEFNPSLAIQTRSIPRAVQREFYQIDLKGSGGLVPDTWTITSGQLPSGINLERPTGRLSGIARTCGTFSFTIQLKDATLVNTANQTYRFEVACDSDADRLPDTIEAVFCTSPNDADSDDDGIKDGDEDKNRNGKVDPGETIRARPTATTTAFRTEPSWVTPEIMSDQTRTLWSLCRMPTRPVPPTLCPTTRTVTEFRTERKISTTMAEWTPAKETQIFQIPVPYRFCNFCLKDKTIVVQSQTEC